MKIAYKHGEIYCRELIFVLQNMLSTIEKVEGLSTKIVSGGNWTGNAADYYVNKLCGCLSEFPKIQENIEYSVLFILNELQKLESLEKMIMSSGFSSKTTMSKK